MKYPSLEKLGPKGPRVLVIVPPVIGQINAIFPIGTASHAVHRLAGLANAQAESRIAGVGFERRHQMMALRSHVARGQQRGGAHLPRESTVDIPRCRAERSCNRKRVKCR